MRVCGPRLQHFFSRWPSIQKVGPPMHYSIDHRTYKDKEQYSRLSRTNDIMHVSDIKNYKGISLSSLLSNVFDSCIISLNSVLLRSDDFQFAYKKSCFTIQGVSMVTEVINYYINNGSSVYMCMLDASKAFDRVTLLTIFKTLYSKGMCPIYLRLLMKI